MAYVTIHLLPSTSISNTSKASALGRSSFLSFTLQGIRRVVCVCGFMRTRKRALEKRFFRAILSFREVWAERTSGVAIRMKYFDVVSAGDHMVVGKNVAAGADDDAAAQADLRLGA